MHMIRAFGTSWFYHFFNFAVIGWSYDSPSSSETTTMSMSRLITKSHTQSWWRHEMKTFSAQLAICAGNSPAPGEFPTQRPVTRSFDVFFDLRLSKRLSKQWWGWWFETPLRPLWRHCNGNIANKTSPTHGAFLFLVIFHSGFFSKWFV